MTCARVLDDVGAPHDELPVKSPLTVHEVEEPMRVLTCGLVWYEMMRGASLRGAHARAYMRARAHARAHLALEL